MDSGFDVESTVATEDNTVGKVRVSKVTGKKVVNYVDNDLLVKDVENYVNRYNAAKEKGEPQPKIPDTIGRAILKITEGMSQRNNFRGYTFIDEMRADAVLACVRAVPHFKVDRSSNAFGFFTYCSWNAMVHRIKIEASKQRLKEAIMSDPMNEFIELHEHASYEADVGRDSALNFYYGGRDD